MSARKTDKATKAVVSLLESDQEWDGPEELAVALIKTLDEVRANKTSYIAVMQFGFGEVPFYVGIGPFAGMKSAANEVAKHPAFKEAGKVAVVPVNTPAHVAQVIGDADSQPALSSDWAIVREDATLFKKGWKGKNANRNDFLKGA